MNEIKELFILMSGRGDNKSVFTELLISENGSQKYNLLYTRLCVLLTLMYDAESDKLNWLKKEFNQLVDITSTVFAEEDEEFNSLYAQSGFKFDAIPYYFEQKDYKDCFDLASFVINLFHETDFIIDQARIINLMCCSTAMFTALKKNQDTLNLLVLVAEYFYKLDIADGTFMHNVNCYITFECTPEEIEWMKEASPVYFGSFYDEKRSIDD